MDEDTIHIFPDKIDKFLPHHSLSVQTFQGSPIKDGGADSEVVMISGSYTFTSQYCMGLMEQPHCASVKQSGAKTDHLTNVKGERSEEQKGC